MKNIRILQQRKAEAIKAAKAINDGAIDRELTAEETTQFDAYMAQVTSLDASIKREQDLDAHDLGASIEIGNGAITVSENLANDPKLGFSSSGEYFKAVRAAATAQSNGVAVDKRLLIGAAAPGTYNHTGNGADGGFAIPPEFSKSIWRMSMGEGSLLPMTSNTEVTGNSMVFPKDETTPWGGDGVQAYWKGEATSGGISKMVLGSEMLRLKELMVMVPVTNELLEDAPALGSYLSPLAAEKIQWKANEAIMFGPGGQLPLGCLSGSTMVVVAKESGQATLTINQLNLSKMRSRLIAGQLKNAVWIGNPDILPFLESMTVGQIPVFLSPQTGVHANFDGTLSGRPLILSEHASAFSAQSDLSLVAMNGYRTITKAGGIQTDTSMHLYFDANATAYRFIFRMDGQPIMKAPITPPAGKSTNTRSHFVTLGAR